MNEQWPHPLPDRYMVRTIDLKMEGGRLLASYRSSGPVQPMPIGKSISDIVHELMQPPPAAPLFEAAVAVADNPGSPLDIAVTGEPLFIVLILGEPSNITFHPDLKAMTHKNQYDREYYGLLRHVNFVEESADPVADCKIIYFVANPAQPDQTGFDHGFNMNVRFAQDPSPKGNPRALDVEIDPDIRYPGQ